MAKILQGFLISNMIYLYGLIQPIRGRNRVKFNLKSIYLHFCRKPCLFDQLAQFFGQRRVQSLGAFTNYVEKTRQVGTLMLVYHCHKPVFTPKIAILRYHDQIQIIRSSYQKNQILKSQWEWQPSLPYSHPPENCQACGNDK